MNIYNTTTIVPVQSKRFSVDEWNLRNKINFWCTEDQIRLADRLLAKSSRIQDKTAERVRLNRNETNHTIEARVNDIEFKKRETEKIRKEILLEVDALETYMARIRDSKRLINNEDLQISKKCVIIREGRVGVDLVHDDVEKELLKEVEIIQEVIALLQRTYEQCKEQVRLLRSILHFMDLDLKDKSDALTIDKYNAVLNERIVNMNAYPDNIPLDRSIINQEEWGRRTDKNFEDASKELNNASVLRSYVDTLLRKVIDDLRRQYYVVNEVFKRRIEETVEVKEKLEIQHSKITRQVNEITRSITKLETAIADKEPYIALAHTRLNNRVCRPGLELCKDLVESTLYNEVDELNQNVEYLQEMLGEAQATLRFLQRTQVQIEEDINVKTHSLKIDEVDCMTIRQSMDYQAY